MKLENIDLEALQRDLEEFARQQRERGWFRRNWLWFVPTVLLVVIVVGAGAAYWAMFFRVYGLEVCQSAMRTIEANEEVCKSLGQPIRTAKSPTRGCVPSARIEEGEIDIIWTIVGPNGQAKAHLFARRIMGKWATTVLDVTLPNGKKVLLNDVNDTEAEAPAFSGPKPETKQPETNAPPPEINLAPPADAPGK
jgi:hypothetical protein